MYNILLCVDCFDGLKFADSRLSKHFRTKVAKCNNFFFLEMKLTVSDFCSPHKNVV